MLSFHTTNKFCLWSREIKNIIFKTFSRKYKMYKIFNFFYIISNLVYIFLSKTLTHSFIIFLCLWFFQGNSKLFTTLFPRKRQPNNKCLLNFSYNQRFSWCFLLWQFLLKEYFLRRNFWYIQNVQYGDFVCN